MNIATLTLYLCHVNIDSSHSQMHLSITDTVNIATLSLYLCMCNIETLHAFITVSQINCVVCQYSHDTGIPVSCEY